MPEGLIMKYFVLNPKAKKHDDFYAAASQSAMLAYAETIMGVNLALADSLVIWAGRETERQVAL